MPVQHAHSSKIRDGIRYFNKYIYNPIIHLFAGRFIYALVIHTGRRSNRRYTTPVVAHKRADGFIIPLPYGPQTDWCRNVLAKNGCEIKHAGQHYRLSDPQIINPENALPQFPLLQRLGFRLFRIEQYLRLMFVH